MPAKSLSGPRSHVLSGDKSNNTLDGRGASYSMKGGNGDDLYLVDDAGDVVDEKKNGGHDTVEAHFSWSLSDNVEDLRLGGAENLEGSGNDLDNALSGNDGDNLLWGGAGDDWFDGGGGSDVIDGGEGLDTASFSGARDDYTITVDGDIITVSADDGTSDTLAGVEFLAFSDGTFSSDDLVAASPPEPEPLPAPSASPLPLDDAATVMEDGEATLDLVANDAPGLRVVEVLTPEAGQAILNADGTVSYRPNPDFFGTDRFTYVVSDAAGTLSSATVSIDVLEVNDAPNATEDAYAAEAGTTLTGNLLFNDSDPDGDLLTALPGNFVTAHGGIVELAEDGTFTYDAADGHSGEDHFHYDVSDGELQSTGHVSINVARPPEYEPAPEAAPEPVPEEVPYYVEGLVSGDTARLNYPGELGSSVTIGFAFLDQVPDYYNSGSIYHEGFRSFTEAQKDATLEILQSLEDLTNITFVETAAEEAAITFGLAELPGMLGVAVAPSGYSGVGNSVGDVWIDASHAGLDFLQGGTAYHTLMHEIGHALGLKHADLPNEEENAAYTVMDSAIHPSMMTTAETFQMYDVAALQHLYGSDTETTSGDESYGFSELDGAVRTIWDSGGNDTLDMSRATYGVNLNLQEGSFSSVTQFGSDNIAIALGTTIENAYGGAYDDAILGNDADNWIEGGAGNDTLSGGGGADTYGFSAGWGQDTIEDYAIGEDRLDFSKTDLTLEDLMITAVDGDTIISDGESNLRLAGVDGEEHELDETFLFF